jgi:cation diffusion facilitator family transporter
MATLPPPKAGVSLPAPKTPREARQERRLRLVLALVFLFFGFEYAGAKVADSVVLKADALHLLLDIFSLALSLAAMAVARRPPTPRYPFGFKRVEPLAALVNGVLVLLATAEIVHEAVEAVQGDVAPKQTIMLVVAAAALVVNGTSAWLLHGAMGEDHHGHGHHAHHLGHDDDHPHDGHSHGHDDHGHALNLRGAWLHLLGDALGAVAALIAAVVIRLGGPRWIDPAASFLVAIILVVGAVRLLRDAGAVLLGASPKRLDVNKIHAFLVAFPGVGEVTDLRLWTLGAGADAMVAHVTTDGRKGVGISASRAVARAFPIAHVTVQELPAGHDDHADDHKHHHHDHDHHDHDHHDHDAS